MPSEILGVAPWVIIAAILAWFGSLYTHRDRKKEKAEESAERIVIHRDGLTFELLTAARQEMAAARAEVEDLRDEVKKLRAMETHVFHFQQALEHLEAILFSDDRANAERNARAFLNRIRRLNEAKGTIANETQRLHSGLTIADKPKKGPKNV